MAKYTINDKVGAHSRHGYGVIVGLEVRDYTRRDDDGGEARKIALSRERFSLMAELETKRARLAEVETELAQIAGEQPPTLVDIYRVKHTSDTGEVRFVEYREEDIDDLNARNPPP